MPESTAGFSLFESDLDKNLTLSERVRLIPCNEISLPYLGEKNDNLLLNLTLIIRISFIRISQQ